MARESSNARPWYTWALAAFAVGLIIGLIIAWGIWPVSYRNALTQDLRPAERDYYLGMVAESFVATGNLQQAQERLQTWPPDELATALADLQERASGTDAKLAAGVQQLSRALNLGPAAPQPAASPRQAAADGAWWKTLCTSALWVLLVLVGVAGLSLLFKRWREARARKSGPAIASTAKAPPMPRTPSEIARREKDEWPLESMGQPLTSGERESFLYDKEETFVDVPPVSVPAREERLQPVAGIPQPQATRPTPVRLQPVASAPQPQASQPARVVAPTESPRPTPGPAPSPAFVKVADYLAVFQMGEPEYDEAFDINDPSEGYMGQCGLQLNEPAGRNRDQAVALQAWLWDSSDPDTRTKVLMSEGTYRDTALRSQQAGEHEVIQVRPGADFELESHDLLLRGKIEKADYTDQEPYRGVFAELQVRMQVYRKR